MPRKYYKPRGLPTDPVREVEEKEVIYEIKKVKVGMRVKLSCGHEMQYDYYSTRFYYLSSHQCDQCPQEIKQYRPRKKRGQDANVDRQLAPHLRLLP